MKSIKVLGMAAITLMGLTMCTQTKTNDETIYEEAAVNPGFPVGSESMDSVYGWLVENIKYPQDAQETGTEGRVSVEFVVEKDGSLSDINIVESATPSLDAEALRIINAMPAWEPAKDAEGNAIRLRVILPIAFQLDSAPTLDDVDEIAQFPGSIYKWLSENISYPEQAEQEKVEGRVLVRFIITEEGNVTDANVLHPVNPLLDAEALRVVNAMPQWQPAQKDGKPVKMTFTLPIQFQLN